ncbi:hypothetical protein Q4567_22040 [Aliiglaciecola sp. 2_MG-2023]|uniref:hypothetical protein n=1 Tax=unclassified Aliiglaciecola TaxID=2593648 RepID=UPI0026E3DD0E|nr:MULTISPECIES: hypothetical protein [unclassified Aliiglaciecola]MDO6713421.1 hypothetical protein [Aliiglaciecola sp. 2_MG-2023]MDO6754559.1 hypothetical protein [Aliiglaciecola sp. 1_MG-2023]
MAVVVLESIQKVAKSSLAEEVWGDRLLEQYTLNVLFNNKPRCFTWVIADSNIGQGVIPDYGQDFEEFLVEICEGEPFKKCKKFVGAVQERFGLAMHYVYSNNQNIKVSFPLVIDKKCI